MYTVEYGLFEDPTFEGTRNFESYDIVEAFLSVMEGLMSYYRIYDENGNELNNEWIVVSYKGLTLPYPIPL